MIDDLGFCRRAFRATSTAAPIFTRRDALRRQLVDVIDIVTTTSTSVSAMEALEEQVRQREQTIAELERASKEKDDKIRDLLSQLDKYRSILQLAGPGGPTAGLLQLPEAATDGGGGSTVASTAAGRKLHRAWGISAEPQSSLSGGRSDQHANLNYMATHHSQKFFKDQRYNTVTDPVL